MPIPLLATAFAAVAPQLAQKGLDLLSGIFRGAADKGADKVAELIKARTGINIQDAAENKLTETQWVQLKQFELENQAQLLEFRKASAAQELEMERLRVEDSKDARQTLSSRDKSEDWVVRRFTYLYATGITALTFCFIFAVIFFGPEDSSSPKWRMIDTVLGFLLGVGLSAIIQIFFGSSQGSQDKSAQLRDLTDRLSTKQQPSGKI